MIYDYNTKNESFLRVHQTLLSSGIRNNKFMLGLYNKNLVDVDPFDRNLSDKLKHDIIVECIENFWYFIREVVRWPLGDGTFVPTKLDRGNAAMYWCSLNGISTWRTNIRQTCSDLSVETMLLWMLMSKIHSRSKVISGASDSFRYEIYKILNLYAMLPESLTSILPPLSTSGTIRRGLEYIRNKNIYSEIKGIPKPRTFDDANNGLRGDMSDVMFFHMAEFIPRLEIIVATRAPVVSPNLDCQKRINIFNSSYGNSDDDSTIFSQTYIEGMIKWKDSFYDNVSDELLCAVCEYGNGVIYIKHDYNDLGYDEKWANDLKSLMDEKSFKREILLRRG